MSTCSPQQPLSTHYMETVGMTSTHQAAGFGSCLWPATLRVGPPCGLQQATRSCPIATLFCPLFCLLSDINYCQTCTQYQSQWNSMRPFIPVVTCSGLPFSQTSSSSNTVGPSGRSSLPGFSQCLSLSNPFTPGWTLGNRTATTQPLAPQKVCLIAGV